MRSHLPAGPVRPLFSRVPPLVLALGAALRLAVPAAAQPERGERQDAPRFAVAEWNTENGLPSNAVRDIRLETHPG